MEFFGYHKDHEARRGTTAPPTLFASAHETLLTLVCCVPCFVAQQQQQAAVVMQSGMRGMEARKQAQREKHALGGVAPSSAAADRARAKANGQPRGAARNDDLFDRGPTYAATKAAEAQVLGQADLELQQMSSLLADLKSQLTTSESLRSLSLADAALYQSGWRALCALPGLSLLPELQAALDVLPEKLKAEYAESSSPLPPHFMLVSGIAGAPSSADSGLPLSLPYEEMAGGASGAEANGKPKPTRMASKSRLQVGATDAGSREAQAMERRASQMREGPPPKKPHAGDGTFGPKGGPAEALKQDKVLARAASTKNANGPSGAAGAAAKGAAAKGAAGKKGAPPTPPVDELKLKEEQIQLQASQLAQAQQEKAAVQAEMQKEIDTLRGTLETFRQTIGSVLGDSSAATAPPATAGPAAEAL